MKKLFVALSIPLLALVLAACSTEGADPTASILDLVVNLDDTATLEVAAGAASADEVNVPAALGGDTTYTLFAPTEEGFANTLDTVAAICGLDSLTAGELIAVLDSIDEEILTNILLYHVVEGEVLAADLEAGPVPTLFGESVVVSLDGGATLTDGNDREVNIVRTDILASNGVVHYIDDVLLPAGYVDAVLAECNPDID